MNFCNEKKNSLILRLTRSYQSFASRWYISTKRRNSWAKNLFEEWKEQRKTRVLGNELCADNLNSDLMHLNNESLSHWLSKFVVETRKRHGERYPQNSLVSLIAGIQGYLKFNGKNINIFE